MGRNHLDPSFLKVNGLTISCLMRHFYKIQQGSQHGGWKMWMNFIDSIQRDPSFLKLT